MTAGTSRSSASAGAARACPTTATRTSRGAAKPNWLSRCPSASTSQDRHGLCPKSTPDTAPGTSLLAALLFFAAVLALSLALIALLWAVAAVVVAGEVVR